MRYSVYNYFGGADKVPNRIIAEIAAAIESVTLRAERGSTDRIRDEITNYLLYRGWSKEVPVSKDSKMTITSVKSDVGLCLQTGNVARMYADLLKLQTLYVDSAIKSAVMIVPSQPIARQLGQNIAHAARLERELEIFSKVIHIPLVVFSME
jgi:hypothetical protein